MASRAMRFLNFLFPWIYSAYTFIVRSKFTLGERMWLGFRKYTSPPRE